MVRIRHSVATRKRRKRVLKQAKGQFGQRSKRFVQAKRSVIKGLTYAYRDRKVKKRQYKSLWIIRINAACRASGVSYSRFIKGLTNSGIAINRKMLADLAATSPESFEHLVKVAQESSPPKKTPSKTKAVKKKTPAEKKSKVATSSSA